jgi:Tol biopolymer transport system component
MSRKRDEGFATLIVAMVLLAGCGGEVAEEAPEPTPETEASLLFEGERHLRNVRQLTFGGENAEAYWSADGGYLIFQSKRDDLGCDQIFVMDADGGNVRLVSTGEGATTCSYFFPAGDRILYSSTHLASSDCPAPPDYSKGYVWKLHPTFDVFTAAADGSGVTRITDHDDYDAEATLSPDGGTIIFTSLRDGDLDLYTMKPDGTDVVRITDDLGYDGGAFFSRDGSRIVWRASRPTNDEEQAEYRALLAEHTIRPMNLEIFVAAADGSGAVQVTDNGAANFAPYFFPDGKRIVFSSNAGDPGGRNFDLWMVNDDGTGLEQVTFNPTFDGFPMFSPDGRHLVFASNRHNAQPRETNIFVAEWVD